jgi:hypothetical protein
MGRRNRLPTQNRSDAILQLFSMKLLACLFCLVVASAGPARAQRSGSTRSVWIPASEKRIESEREILLTAPMSTPAVFASHRLGVHQQVSADGYNAWRAGVAGATIGGVLGGVFGYLGSAYGCGDPGCGRAQYVIMGAVIGAAVGVFVEYAFRHHPKCPVLDGCGP